MFFLGSGASSLPRPAIPTALLGPRSPDDELRRRVAQLQQASESLERAQRARVDRVLLDWQRSSQIPHLWRGTARYGDWRPPVDSLSFRIYLDDADRHEAVARRSARSSRLWFRQWRWHALAALHLGLDPHALVALVRSTPVVRDTRAAPRAARRGEDAHPPGLRERLENVIFPNAPGTARSLRHLAAGDGLTTVRI